MEGVAIGMKDRKKQLKIKAMDNRMEIRPMTFAFYNGMKTIQLSLMELRGTFYNGMKTIQLSLMELHGTWTCASPCFLSQY